MPSGILLLSEEQQLLQESAAGFLAAHSPISAYRSLITQQSNQSFCHDLWTQMSNMGWAGMLVPECYGGSEFNYAGVGVVLEQMGRQLTLSPFFSSAVIGVTLLLTGNEQQKQHYLPDMAAGRRLVSLAVDETDHHHPGKIALSAKREGANFMLKGKKTFVLEGHVADDYIVAARTAGIGDLEQGISLFLVSASEPTISTTQHRLVDGRVIANVQFEQTACTEAQILGRLNQAWPTLSRALDIGRICLAAQLLGCARESFERTLAYLRERKQFGVHVGSFQALQHRAAHLFTELEMSQSLILLALQAIDDNQANLPLLASAAKASMSDLSRRVANEAIQMHGGMGMTDECDIGLFFKHAAVMQALYGNYQYHADRFALLQGY